MPSQLQGRAKASREDDKRKILHLIAGTPEEVWKNQETSATQVNVHED